MILKGFNFQSCSINKYIYKVDFLLTLMFSILSFFSPTISSLCIILYYAIRIIYSQIEESFYFILLFVSNTNVFFLGSIPVCNLLIVIALFKFAISKNIRLNNVCFWCLLVCLYDLMHIFIYSLFNVFQSIVWCISLSYGALFLANCLTNYNHDKAKLYFLDGIIISAVYGLFYRIVSGQGLSVTSFNTSDMGRFGGGFYDPNYFSMVCLLLFIMVIEKIVINNADGEFFSMKSNLCFLFILGVLLLLCFAGLSKMFILVLFCLLIFLLPLLFVKGEYGKRFRLYSLLSFILLFLFFFVSKIDFYYLFDVIISRFKNVSNLNDFTTGRVQLVLNAFFYLFNNASALYFGTGVQTYGERIGDGNYIHNFYAEIIVTFGFVGAFLFIMFLKSMILNIKNYYKYNINSKIIRYIKALPLIIFCICILGLNVIEVESFIILSIFIIINFWYIDRAVEL